MKASLQGLPREVCKGNLLETIHQMLEMELKGAQTKMEMNLRRGEKPNRNAKEFGLSLIVLGAIEEWET